MRVGHDAVDIILGATIVNAHQHETEYQRERANLHHPAQGSCTFPGWNHARPFDSLATFGFNVETLYELAHRPDNQYGGFDARKDENRDDFRVILKVAAIHIWRGTEQIQRQRRRSE